MPLHTVLRLQRHAFLVDFARQEKRLAEEAAEIGAALDASLATSSPNPQALFVAGSASSLIDGRDTWKNTAILGWIAATLSLLLQILP